MIKALFAAPLNQNFNPRRSTTWTGYDTGLTEGSRVDKVDGIRSYRKPAIDIELHISKHVFGSTEGTTSASTPTQSQDAVANEG